MWEICPGCCAVRVGVQRAVDILRRNTDYALRLIVHLAKCKQEEARSTRQLAGAEDVSYQLACKLLQRLHDAGLVRSRMGPKGGYALAKEPAEIALLDVVEAIQGPVKLNRCLLSDAACSRTNGCPVRTALGALQAKIDEFLSGVTLDDLLKTRAGRSDRG